MKIVQKTVVANLFYIVLIALIGFFAYQNVNLVLTKFHFVEIADDLNATFLEMRLSEKNFFLYRDNEALDAIKDKLDYALKMIQHARMDIIKATGAGNFARLKNSLEKYQTAIERVKIQDSGDRGVQHSVREAGRELRDYSEQITHLERAKVNRIIADSRRWLFYSLVVFVLTAIGVSHFLFLKILHSLKKIEEVAHSISEGNFSKVESNIPADEVGAAIKAINAMSDELKNREEQIIQSRKLASIGILTAGVAHELGNPLNNISMLAQTGQYLDENLDHTERLEYLKNIEAETERIQEIVKNLLDFSKPRKANLKPTDLNGLVQKTLKLVQNMITVSNLDLGLDLAPDLPMVFIDLNQIQEVLINLITNAAQVCVPGDRVSIATRLSEKTGFLEVDIADTGAGISPQQLPYIFDPFFSTKGADGTGLGLSISYGIVKNHNGAIQVKSEVGVGTTFTVELPIYTEQEKAKK